jgi:hypothetical protein
VREDLRVPRVRRLAAEHDRREARAAEDLVHQRELHLAVALAAELRTEMARPELAALNLRLERPDERVPLGIAHVVGVAEYVVERLDLALHELLDPVELGLELWVGLEIPSHGGVPPFHPSTPAP